MIIELENDFEQNIVPLDRIIDVVFENLIRKEIDNLISRYKNKFLTKKSTSNDEFKDLINRNAIVVRDSLSKNYIEFIVDKYFSSDGFVLYILSELNIKSKNYMKTVNSSTI